VGGPWAGLACVAQGPARPGLRVEVTGGRRLLLRQADRVVLLGVQRARRRGVHYARTGQYRSPLPPLTAGHARQVRESSADDDAWAARWTHEYLGFLEAASDGPLYGGHWIMAWGMPSWSVAGHWPHLTTVDPDRGHITWFGYGDPDEDQRDVLPLRRLSPATAGRVRSYRRQAREGILPPALLWWVSGLNTLVVVDGHDRIAAALAEHTVPAVIVLAPNPDPLLASMAYPHFVRAYEGREQHLRAAVEHGDDLAKAHLAKVTRRFATQVNEEIRREGRARAWPVRGGPAAWQSHAARLVPDWHVGPA
jgi:hypothetical protein